MLELVVFAALATAALVCVVVTALVGLNLSTPGAKALFLASGAELWWLAGYASELLSGPWAILFERFQWLGVVVIPVAWAVFVVQYTGRHRYLTGPRVAGLAVIPVATAGAALFRYDGVLRYDPTVTSVQGLSIVDGEFAPLYWVFVVFTWLLVAASAVLLIEFVVDHGHLYTERALALIGAGLVPIVASILDTVGWGGPEVLQLTPLSFALSSGLAALAIVEFEAFRSAPVPAHLATETAVESVGDPTFFLDSGGTVVDCNPAAVSVVGTDRESLLGKHRTDIDPLSGIDEESVGSTVTVEDEGATRYYDVKTAPIEERGDQRFGTVVTLRDITARRERKQRLNALNDVLRATIQEEMETVKRAVDDDDDAVTDVDVLRDHASVALEVSDRAGELASMVEPEAESPADIVPIIHEEIDAAREWKPEVSFVLDASLGEWAYCSGLFEPVFRVSLRHAAERSLAGGGDDVVGISVTAGPEAVTVSVSDSGPPLSDHERAVLCEGVEPKPSDRSDMSRWLVNWGVRQAGGNVRVGTDGEHTSIELTFPRTDEE